MCVSLTLHFDGAWANLDLLDAVQVPIPALVQSRVSDDENMTETHALVNLGDWLLRPLRLRVCLDPVERVVLEVPSRIRIDLPPQRATVVSLCARY